MYQLYFLTFSGRGQFGYWFGHDPASAAWEPFLILIQTAFGLGVAAGLLTGLLQDSPVRRWLGFVTLIIVLLFVQTVITPQASGVHHFVVFWPLNHLQLVLCGLTMGPTVQRLASLSPWQRFVAGGLKLLSVILLVPLIASALSIHRDFAVAMKGTRFNPLWDPAIDALSEKIRSLNVDRIYAVDWGVSHPLIALAPPEERRRYYDTWPLFSEPPGSTKRVSWMFETFVVKRRVVFVSYDRPLPGWPQNHLSEATMLKSWRGCVTSEETVPDETGKPLYSLVVLDGRRQGCSNRA